MAGTFGSGIGTSVDAELDRVIGAGRDQYDALVAQHAEEVSALEAEITRLEAEIARLQPKPVDPPTPVTKTRFGAGGGNIDRTKQYGTNIDRRYYGAGDTAKCITDVTRNKTAGILSWISFKCPASWADMAAGKQDTWAKGLINKLVALDTPVWLAFHHEPEGDGVMPDWTKMQDRLSRFVPANSKVKFWLIVTGWHQSKGTTTANKWPAIYPKGAPIFGIAYDYPYQAYGNETKNGVTTFNNAWTDPNYYIDHVADTAAALSASEGRKIEAGCAEWGYGDEAYTKDKTWAEKVMKRAIERKLLGVTYFDTRLNSSHSWYLGDGQTPKRAYVEGLHKTLNG